MIIKLTDTENEPVLIGTESIIRCTGVVFDPNGRRIYCTKIQSRGAMIETTYVLESIEEIYNITNK